MTTMEWVAVRCCCTPRKVFGFLQVPREAVRGGRTYSVLDRHNQVHSLKLAPFSEVKCPSAFLVLEALGTIDPNSFELAPSKREVAIYSDDRPIEFWRSIEGFVEALEQPA